MEQEIFDEEVFDGGASVYVEVWDGDVVKGKVQKMRIYCKVDDFVPPKINLSSN